MESDKNRSDIVPFTQLTHTLKRCLDAAFGDDPLERVKRGFLGVDARPSWQVGVAVVRLAVLWRYFDDFLASERWQRSGDMAWNRAGQPMAPATECLFGSGEPPLEFPTRWTAFLERGEERMMADFNRGGGGPGNFVEMRLKGTERPREFFDRWIAFARQQGAKHPLKLHASGGWTRESGAAAEPLLEEPVRRDLQFVLDRFLRREELGLERFGVRARGGVILAGPPGTGKTSVGRYLERTVPCSFLWATPTDVDDPQAVTEVFELARLIAPTILFLEDLDVVAESRNRRGFNGPVGQLLTELDGAPGDHPVLSIATTNRLDVLEEALRSRPGRFDLILELGPFGNDLRQRFLEQRFGQCELEPGVLAKASAGLSGATGAELEAFVNHAITTAALERSPEQATLRVGRQHVQAGLQAARRARPERGVGFLGHAHAESPRLFQ